MHRFLTTIITFSALYNGMLSGTQNETAKNQAFIQDQIVQVHAFKYAFNWIEPYKKGELRRGTGTAFGVSPDGDFYTNFHVVRDAFSLFIQHARSKERFEVEFVGGSPENDIAHIRLKPEELKRFKQLLQISEVPYLPLGDSDKVNPGDPITVIGYPLSYEGIKRTTGIVSGQESFPSFGECLSITAATNPGNSGGPCLNSKGEVIGILSGSAINQRSAQTAEGFHLLIPINRMRTLSELLQNGKVIESPFFGFTYSPLTQTTLTYLQVPENNGVYITKVLPESIAFQTGLQQGDVLTALNNLTVDHFGFVNASWTDAKINLFDMLARCHNQQKISFTIYRSGEKIELNGTVTFSSPLKITYKYPPFQKMPDYLVFNGIVIMELTKNHLDLLRDELNFFIANDELEIIRYLSPQQQYRSKLLITHVFPETDLAKSRVINRFGARNIIKSVNHIPVTTVEEFEQAVLSEASSGIVSIETSDNTFFVLSIKDALATDMLLSPKHGYPLSALTQKLAQLPPLQPPIK